MQPESRFKIKVKDALRGLGLGPIWFTKVQQVSLRGTPDLLMCIAGRFVAWELKVGDNVADALQKYHLEEIKKAGGIARVVYPENLNECLEELKCLVRQEQKKK